MTTRVKITHEHGNKKVQVTLVDQDNQPKYSPAVAQVIAPGESCEVTLFLGQNVLVEETGDFLEEAK